MRPVKMASERTPGNVQDCQWGVSGASLEISTFGQGNLVNSFKISGDWSWKRCLLMWREIQTARNCILDDVWSFTWWNDSRNWAEPKHGVNVESPLNGAQVLVWAGSIFTFWLCRNWYQESWRRDLRSFNSPWLRWWINFYIINLQYGDLWFSEAKIPMFFNHDHLMTNKQIWCLWFNSWPFYPRSLEVTYKPYKPLSLGHKKPSQKGHEFFITW